MSYDVVFPHYSSRYSITKGIAPILVAVIPNTDWRSFESQLEQNVEVALREQNNPSKNGHIHNRVPSKPHYMALDVSSRGHHNHYRGHKNAKPNRVIRIIKSR